MSIIASSIMVTQFRIHTESWNCFSCEWSYYIYFVPVFTMSEIDSPPPNIWICCFWHCGNFDEFFSSFFLHLPKFYIWGILNIFFYNSLTTLSLNVPNQKLFEILMSFENNNTTAGINTNCNEKYLTYSFWHVLN